MKPPASARPARRGPRPATGRRDSLLATLALAALTFTAYANAGHDALVMDDASFPPRPEAVSLASLLQLFREDVWAPVRVVSGVYRPLAMAWLQIQSLMWGAHLPAYHYTLVATHVLTTLVVFVLLREILMRTLPGGDRAESVPWPAWLGALAFGVHPIHTEAVNSIFNGSEVLATLGVVTGLWIVLTRDRRSPGRTWVLAGASYLAALLCKESAVTFPALAALLLALPLRGEPSRLFERWRPLAWLAIPLGIAVVLRAAAIGLGPVAATQSVSAAHAMGLGFADRLALWLTSQRDFALMLVWPHPLRASYDDYAASAVLLAVGFLAALAVAAGLLWRRAPAASIGLAFFFVALLPSSRLLSHLGVVVTLAERYTYLPSVGAALVLAVALGAAARRHRDLPWAIGVPLCVVLAGLTFVRNTAWRSDVALWEADVAVAPQNPDALKWLTAAYLNTQRLRDAERLCDEARPRHPEAIGFQLNCAAVYGSLGRQRGAETVYREVVAQPGNHPMAHLQLARLLAREGRTTEADEQYEAAVAGEADPVRRHTHRGEQLRRLHPERADEARAEYEAALRLDPRHEPARNGLRQLPPTSPSPR